MERESSVSSDPTCQRRQRLPVLPPWEVREVAQVPFVRSGSPPVAERDTQGFFMARPTTHGKHRPKLSTSTSAPGGSEYASPVSEHSSTNPWKTTEPLPSSPPAAMPSNDTPAYERPAYGAPGHYVPTPQKLVDQRPPTYIPQAPPTPPDSVSRASLRSASASPPIRPASKALPGTMSSRASRNRSASQHGTKSTGHDRRTNHAQGKQDNTGLGKRFKSAFREMFKKDPVDETQFERISDRHWTEEY
ncbi:hypothetical protein Q7P37_011133 [Cladosporium fusiforme]